MVMKFRKKPVVIEAIQWTGRNLRDVSRFFGETVNHNTSLALECWDDYCATVARDGLKVHTLEGVMRANVGDWIIKGVKGEYYPCKPDVFSATYDVERTA